MSSQGIRLDLRERIFKMSKRKIKVLTWNMNKRPRAWQYLLDQEPEFALLQETPVLAKPLPNYHVLQESGNYPRGSTILSKTSMERKFPLAKLKPDISSLIDLLSNRTVGGEYLIKDLGKMIVISTHLDSRPIATAHITPGLFSAVGSPNWQKTKRVWQSDVAFAAFRDLAKTGQRFIVGGDLNMSRLMDQKMPFNESVATWFEVQKTAGLVDCCWAINGKEVRTIFQEKKAHYQLDHLFCDKETAKSLVGCYVDVQAVKDGLSDHAPLFIELAF
jgi:endonuclease/exonuclease/phosphatase family metal-dependent hydrolase